MELSTLSRPCHEVVELTRLLPGCRKGIEGLQDLALRFTDPGWKNVFAHLYHQQSSHLTELEEKIWEWGGQTHTQIQWVIDGAVDPEDEPADPMSAEKRLVLRCIHEQTFLLHQYADVRRASMPLEVRMVLLRHELQIREVLERLQSMFAGRFAIC